MNKNIFNTSLVSITTIFFFVGLAVVAGQINLVNGPCTVVYQIGNSCDCPGSNVMQDIAVVDSKINECYLKCLKMRACTHFTHNTAKCILKRLKSTINYSYIKPVDLKGNGVCGRIWL